MHHNNPTHDRVTSSHRLQRAVRRSVLGGLGLLALAAAIQPAQANYPGYPGEPGYPGWPWLPEIPWYPPIDPNPTPTPTPTPEEPVNTAPTLHLPSSPIVVEANGPWGAQAYFEVSAKDEQDEVAPVATASPESGSTFGLGETTVNVSATDKGGLTTTGSFLVKVQDTTAPWIQLNSNQCTENLTVPVGSEFFEPGAWAYDSVDQYVEVSSSGSVDTSTVGSYTITYTAKDRSGNAATPVTRTVTVVNPMPKVNKRRYSGGNFEGQGDFNITAGGSVSAALQLKGQTWRATFPLTQRNQTVVFNGPKKSTLEANLFVSVNGGGEPVIVVNAADTSLELKPVLFTAQNPAPASVAGTYTSVFRSYGAYGIAGASTSSERQPLGSGFATINVAKDGKVRAVGFTAEGTPVSGSSYLVKAPCHKNYAYAAFSPEEPTNENPIPSEETAQPAQFHLHMGLYTAAKRGSLSGIFTLDRSNHYGSITGDFRWEAPSGALALYRGGMETWGEIVGGRYEKSQPAGMTGLLFTFDNASAFVASGTVTTSPVFFDMSTTDSQRSVGLRCRYTLETGVLTGARYRGSAARNYKAIWLQEQGTIEGFSTSGDGKSHGAVNLENTQPEQPTLPL